jgi:hypothetical protein
VATHGPIAIGLDLPFFPGCFNRGGFVDSFFIWCDGPTFFDKHLLLSTSCDKILSSLAGIAFVQYEKEKGLRFVSRR